MGMSKQIETVTRYVGSCQICEGEFKLTTDHVMVHHGYKRPGHGFIVGDCMAVGAPAYEQSCEVLKAYTAGIRKTLEDKRSYQAKLLAHEVKVIPRATWPNGRGFNARPVWVDTHEGEPEFARAYESAKYQVEADIRNYEREVARCEARIAAWKLLPVRTVEEVAREAKAAQDARKAVRDAAKAKRQAEAKARADKAADLKARREAIAAEFKAGFEKLAAGEITPEVKAAAYKLAEKVSLRKHSSWLYCRDLGCDDALILLGLATRETVNGHPWIKYNYPLYG